MFVSTNIDGRQDVMLSSQSKHHKNKNIFLVS